MPHLTRTSLFFIPHRNLFTHLLQRHFVFFFHQFVNTRSNACLDADAVSTPMSCIGVGASSTSRRGRDLLKNASAIA
jgi:hypothetical protein